MHYTHIPTRRSTRGVEPVQQPVRQSRLTDPGIAALYGSYMYVPCACVSSLMNSSQILALDAQVPARARGSPAPTAMRSSAALLSAPPASLKRRSSAAMAFSSHPPPSWRNGCYCGQTSGNICTRAARACPPAASCSQSPTRCHSGSRSPSATHPTCTTPSAQAAP